MPVQCRTGDGSIWYPVELDVRYKRPLFMADSIWAARTNHQDPEDGDKEIDPPSLPPWLSNHTCQWHRNPTETCREPFFAESSQPFAFQPSRGPVHYSTWAEDAWLFYVGRVQVDGLIKASGRICQPTNRSSMARSGATSTTCSGAGRGRSASSFTRHCRTYRFKARHPHLLAARNAEITIYGRIISTYTFRIWPRCADDRVQKLWMRAALSARKDVSSTISCCQASVARRVRSRTRTPMRFARAATSPEGQGTLRGRLHNSGNGSRCRGNDRQSKAMASR